MAVKGNRWVWRSLTDDTLRDPAQRPTTAQEHKHRILNKLWGPNWARLCPIEVLGDGTHGASCKDLLTQQTFETAYHSTIPFYEGLLVLDTMEKLSVKPSWFGAKLQRILAGQRLKQKDKEFNSWVYVLSKLLNTAVTGPSFVDGAGTTHQHRRLITASGNNNLGEGVTNGEYFGVKELIEYLPPWEAILHSKCGLYQDYFLVHWAEPHDKATLEGTESGSERLGCSWEPDECLPDLMDSDRNKAKREWAAKSVRFDPRWVLQIVVAEQSPESSTQVEPPIATRPAPVAKRPAPYVESAEDQQQKEKIRKMVTNEFGQPVKPDFFNPLKKHGWDRQPPTTAPRSQDEAQVKQGWPKTLSEYPVGHAPANPPGFCKASCDCMEDWHLGRGHIPAREQDKNVNRVFMAEGSVSTFGKCGLVNVRGACSGQCYFEVIRIHTIEPAKASNDAWLVKEALDGVLQEFARQIPLSAFFREDADATCEQLIPALVPALLPELDATPSRYVILNQLSWLILEPSGLFRITAADIPVLASGSQDLSIQCCFENIPQASENKSIRLTVTDDKGNQVRLLKTLTQKVAKAMQEVKLPPRLKSALNARLRTIGDEKKLREISVGRWVAVICEAARLTRILATSRVGFVHS